MNDMANDPVGLTLTAINLNWLKGIFKNYSGQEKHIDGIWLRFLDIFLDTVLEKLADTY